MTRPGLRRLWCYLPIALAILVALWQIYLAHFRGLTPAKGGGFGLFSTVDKLDNRQVRASLFTDTREVPLAFPRIVSAGEPLRKPIYRAASLPSERHLRVIADELLAAPRDEPIRAVRVEVWKAAFDSATLGASRVKVAELHVEKGSR